MNLLVLIPLFLVSIKAAPYSDNSVIARYSPDSFSNDINHVEESEKVDNTKDDKNQENTTSKSSDMQIQNTSKVNKNRWHKSFSWNKSYIPSTNKYPSVSRNENYMNFIGEKRPGNRKNHQDSKIFYVRLPPAPYFYVPGLGYISNPPKFSTSSLKPYQPHSHHTNSIIRLPIDFVSNGKPTSVYQWNKNKNHKPAKKPINSISKLKKGPYIFNGKPTSLYLLSPNGQTSLHQPIKYADIQENNIY
ncbi:uncharacterized protein [Chelonus insularis]|nr:uncharacterized protein LOC118065784 isoform X2 [Chelonus insularis]